MPGHGKMKIKSRDGGYHVAIIGDEVRLRNFIF
jgi:hypothetical protein